MAEATFKHGSPLMVDHTTAGTAIAAGEVVVTGSCIRIAHVGIPANTLGALAAGGGVYEVAKNDDDEAWTIGVPVYWVAADNHASTNADTGSNVLVGYAVAAAVAAAAVGLVHHVAP